MEMNFCRRCGTKLNKKSEGIYQCDTGHMIYGSPNPTAGVFFVTDDNQVMLSIRGIEPAKGDLDSFGGFVDEGESAEHAAIRELEEELGLTPEHYEELHYLCSAPGIYPYEGEIRTVMTTFFWSRLKPGANPIPADDVAGIKTIPLATITDEGISAHDVWVGILKLKEAFGL